MAIKKILITGGAGFIGTHLAERLCKEYKVVLLDNLRRNSLSTIPDLLNNSNIEFVHGDILEKTNLTDVIKGCNIVIHLAAVAGVSSYYKEPYNTLHVNICGTLNVLECCKNAGVEKVFDVSTSEVYGMDAYDVNEGSKHEIGPINDLRWTYAVSKLASEHLTLRYGEKFGFKAFTLRPFNIYGPRQTGEGAISNFMKAVVKGEPIIIYGNGTAIRAWCYISDCIDAFEAVIKNENLKSGTFNIGNPRETYSTVGLARLICQMINDKVPIMFKEVSRTEICVRVPNIDSARHLIDFEPKVTLPMGLKYTYRWFKEYMA